MLEQLPRTKHIYVFISALNNQLLGIKRAGAGVRESKQSFDPPSISEYQPASPYVLSSFCSQDGPKCMFRNLLFLPLLADNYKTRTKQKTIPEPFNIPSLPWVLRLHQHLSLLSLQPCKIYRSRRERGAV